MDTFDRSEISFEQAEGVEALPSQMALKTTTPRLRARLWDVIYSSVVAEMDASYNSSTLGKSWATVLRRFAIERLAMLSDEVGKSYKQFATLIRPAFTTDDYVRTLGVTEWMVRNAPFSAVRKGIAAVLEEERCAYRVIDLSIVPVASEEEGRTLLGAHSLLDRTGLNGAKSHLNKAGSLLTAGQYADSIRESIHAVESVARSLTGEQSLSLALKSLAKNHPLHPALEKGFNSIYGYTSDANGIRHPMVGNEGVQAGEEEAIFMLGACASFVTYLIRIGRPQS